MRRDTVTLVVPSGATVGTAVDVSIYTALSFELAGVTAASATVVLEGSADGTNFVALYPGSVTADTIVSISDDIVKIQAHRTVAGSGAITCIGTGLVVI
jgi:hypothetical protein